MYTTDDVLAAYADRYGTRPESLDTLARTSGHHIWSAISTEEMTRLAHGNLADTYIADNHPELPYSFLEQAEVLYANLQEYHYGVGASEATELRSTYLVTRTTIRTDGSPWTVIHAYGAHSWTEAQDHHRVVGRYDTKDDAIAVAHHAWRTEQATGAMAHAYPASHDFWGQYRAGWILEALDDNTPTIAEPAELSAKDMLCVH